MLLDFLRRFHVFNLVLELFKVVLQIYLNHLIASYSCYDVDVLPFDRRCKVFVDLIVPQVTFLLIFDRF